jgi:hypothetical protein
MKTRNMTTTLSLAKMVGILMLAVGLVTNTVMAQSKPGPNDSPGGHYAGVESSPGTLEPSTGIRYGNTLVMNSFGKSETRHLTISLDYSTTQFGPNNFIVNGGSWSLVVFRDGAYFGTLYGNVSSGNVFVQESNNSDPGYLTQVTQVNLQGLGGLGEFEGKKAIYLGGACDVTTDLRKGQAEGIVNFNF